MPADEPEAPGGSCFIRVQEVLLAGGFCAVDSRSKAPALERLHRMPAPYSHRVG
jgi:hypothetical protein